MIALIPLIDFPSENRLLKEKSAESAQSFNQRFYFF